MAPTLAEKLMAVRLTAGGEGHFSLKVWPVAGSMYNSR